MGRVDSPEVFGNQHLDGPPQELVPAVAKQSLDPGVDDHDVALAVGDQNALGRGLQERSTPGLVLAQRLLRPPALGEVPHHGDHVKATADVS